MRPVAPSIAEPFPPLSRGAAASLLARSLGVRPADMIAFWPLNEASGSVAKNAAYAGGISSQLITDPTFVDGTGWTTGSQWSISGGAAHVVLAGGASYLTASNVLLAISDYHTYRVTFTISNWSSGNCIVSFGGGASVGTVSGNGSHTITARNVGSNRILYFQASPGATFDLDNVYLWKTSERDGGYSGPTLSGGVMNRIPCPSLDGVNDAVPLFTPALASAFVGSAGSISFWFKASSAGVWSDSVSRYLLYWPVDNDNYLRVDKTSANIFQAIWRRGASSVSVSIPVSDTAPHHLAVTWDEGADEVKYYLDGILLETDTGLGTWVGALTAATIGAVNSTGTNPFPGLFGMAGVWSAVLTPDEIKALAGR